MGVRLGIRHPGSPLDGFHCHGHANETPSIRPHAQEHERTNFEKSISANAHLLKGFFVNSPLHMIFKKNTFYKINL